MNPAPQIVTSPLLAYTVTSSEEHVSAVVFHRHAVAARRLGASEIDDDFSGVTLRRAPEFDHCAPGPVPDEALYRAGWFLECQGCSSRVSEQRVQDSQQYPEECGYLRENWESVHDDEHDGGGLPLAPVFLKGGGVFCCPACQETSRAQDLARRDEQEQRVVAATAAALARFPGCTVRRVWTGGSPTRPDPVDLALPGSTDAPPAEFTWEVGADEISCAPGSLAAWEAYRETMKGKTP